MTERTYSCFLSYSHQDEPFARKLYDRLREAGLEAWYATEDMQAGQKIHEQIYQAIGSHEKLLMILSGHSMQSEWVRTEIRKARRLEVKQGRRILFPIRLVGLDQIRDWECFDADTGTDMAVEVREYFIPDFSLWQDDAAFEKAFGRLLNDLRAEEKEE